MTKFQTVIILFCLFVFTNIALAQAEPETTVKSEIKPRIYHKSNGLAMLLSAIVPGGGQFYTENYLKGILFLGLEGTLGYLAIKNHLDYNETNDVKFKKQRNNLLWWIASVKLLSIADAYVSANMYKFKDQMKLSFDYEAQKQSFTIGFIIKTSI